MSPLPQPRAAVADLRGSIIREVSELGRSLDGVIGLWFGEAEAETPDVIRRAAFEALSRGDTRYTPNLGLDGLRAAIARYLTRLGRDIAMTRVAVTPSGISAIMLCCQAVLDPGDRVVMPQPCWPNLFEIPTILGATVETVPLRLTEGRWRLDMDEMLAALRPGTRMVVLNAPGNPTGWTLTAAEQATLLSHCRRHGIWILADDVYERQYFEAPAAPSFLSLATAEDRLFSVNSFSKSWSMTGWRLGWIVAPPGMIPSLGKLLEYNISCAPGFVQAAGIAALDQGEPEVLRALAHNRAMRDLCTARLNAMPGVAAPVPEGAMYSFFSVAGCTDSLAMAKALLREDRVGLAPGAAFGPAGEGCLRLCFAVSAATLSAACDRVEAFMQRHAAWIGR